MRVNAASWASAFVEFGEWPAVISEEKVQTWELRLPPRAALFRAWCDAEERMVSLEYSK